MWIDAICILQDSTEDWQRESSKMGHMYERAYLVISANVAPDNDAGLLSERRIGGHMIELSRKLHYGSSPNQLCAVKELEDLTADQHAKFVDCGGYRNSYEEWQDPVFSRAWCLQERLLATRVFHFTST